MPAGYQVFVNLAGVEQLPRLRFELLLPGVLVHGGLRVAGNVRDLVEARVIVVAALPLRAPAVAQAVKVEGVRELEQPVLALRQGPKVCGRRALETLSRFQRR